MFKSVCPVCGAEATACYWSDIMKEKDSKRKVFTIIEPIPFDKDTSTFRTDKIRKDYPESTFFAFSDTPTAFSEEELAELNTGLVGPHCVKCQAKLEERRSL